MGEVKLIGFWGSPFSRRVEMALKLKGIEYEYIEEDLSNKSELLLKYNPVHKKVPVLLHNRKVIAESLIILEYIEETWQNGPAILPKDPYERAMARFWAKFIDEKCLPAMWKACWSTGEERDKAVEEAANNLNFLENEIKGKKFFGGDALGLADFAGNLVAYWFPILTEAVELELLTEEKYPNLFKWIGEFTSCGILKENLPPKDKMFAFFRARVEGPIDDSKYFPKF